MKTQKPKPYRYLSFLIPLALDNKLKAEAKKQDRSVAWIIRKALEKYLPKN